MAKLTEEMIEAACLTALTIERASGVDITPGTVEDHAFKLGFGRGAQWIFRVILELQKREEERGRKG